MRLVRLVVQKIRAYLYLKKHRFASDMEKECLRKYIVKSGIKGVSIFPYEFTFKYKNLKVETGVDNDGYKYIIHNGKRMYGKKKWSKKQMARYYRYLLKEQDLNSPHCYFGTDGKQNILRRIDGESIVADIGAAEGMFSLDVVEKAKKIYLFECDNEWLEPLKRTFHPWNEKTEIINVCISSKNNGKEITLDKFFENRDINVIKADIEGNECKMMRGGNKTFDKCSKVYICAYHRKNDKQEIISFLRKKNYEIQINSGYMFLYNNRHPYFSRGIIFGYK